MGFQRSILCGLALVAALCGRGLAAEGPAASIAPEWRIGLSLQDPTGRERETPGLSTLLLLPLAQSAWLPIPTIGGTLNLSGRTSLAHAGLLWRVPLTARLFTEFGLGGALHNGSVAGSARRNGMGCAGAFRESLGLGLNLDAGWRAVATLEHVSNAGLCQRNRGLTNLNIMLGYSF